MIIAAIRSALFVAAFVLVIWFIGELIGFEIALVTTLLLSVGLTFLLNLVLGAFQHGRQRHS